MKLSKELEEKVKKAIEEYEQEKRENKIKFYSEEEAMKIMFRDLDNYLAKKV